MSDTTPTILLILDGWGQAPVGPGNAITQAATPVLDALLKEYPHTRLTACGREVGLPDGFMGNSEVGHMNIGAGRVVYQDMTRIDIAIERKSFASQNAIAHTFASAKHTGGRVHLMGLLSDGGVHSHIRHLEALIQAAKAAGVPVSLHLFMDGRDTDPHSGLEFVRTVEGWCGDNVRIATLCGRYFAMDRDKHWERTQMAWNALVLGEGKRFLSAEEAMQAYYAGEKTDEFIPPTCIGAENLPGGIIQDGDAVFFYNFRADRARQLTHCFADTQFEGFGRKKTPRLAFFATMTPYDATLPVPAAFERENLTETLGEVVSAQGWKQFRVAETEKYAHVTYFFNGGVEPPFGGEDRQLIPSPRDVATYDQKPEMSVEEVTSALLEAWQTEKYRFFVCNFANMDMVGHTGVIPATIKAVEAVDRCVGRVLEAVKAKGGRLLVTADHGNADEMLTSEKTPQTAHSKNPVAFVICDSDGPRKLRPLGKLGDIAPTILHLWGVPQPSSMTGLSLLED